jgi:RNA polymerase sigma-70 factor (ECF subfamily)
MSINNKGKAEELWKQFSSALRTFIMSKVKSEAEADDILQNVYLKIHDNIQSLKDESKIQSWIYQITRNLITDYYRSEKRMPKPEELKTEALISSSDTKFMDKAVRDMLEMMEEMPPEYCEALRMTELEGISQKEYAERKGLSYSGAKSRVQRARILLKDMLLNCCHYQFDKYGTVFDIQTNCCCCCISGEK